MAEDTLKAPPQEWACSIVISSIRRDGEPYRESFELAVPGAIEHWGQEHTFPDGVGASVTATYTGERILVEVSVDAEYTVPCARCLEAARVRSVGTVRYLFSLDPHDGEDTDDGPDDGEISVIHIDAFEGEIDLADMIWEVLLLGLPERVLCREDCKGLCPICGADLNAGSCGCVPDTSDPRLAVLKDLMDGA